MQLAVVSTRANLGIEARSVAVEVDISSGLPAFSIVGLPETAVKESRHRVRSAIQNSRFEFPDGRITVNLAPAELPKEGGRYDLAIALGILAASNQIPRESLASAEFGAELALTGEMRDFQSVLPMVIAASRENKTIFLASKDAAVASCVKDAKIYAANNLLQICEHLNGINKLNAIKTQVIKNCQQFPLDMAEVQGQYQAKRALEIAAAGGHSILMIGSPGVGKTMLASRLAGILPSLSNAEYLEIAAIHSLVSNVKPTNLFQRPFRAPHHSCSSVALVGGGRVPKPGEISLAHNGVLFLDELPEFSRASLEALREPLESGVVNIARAAYAVSYPAKFQLIAAMNPCPCGYIYANESRCRCTPEQIARYQNKISGPLLDRIDLQVQMAEINMAQAAKDNGPCGEKSEQIRKRVEKSRQIQQSRQGCINANLTQKVLKKVAQLNQSDEAYLLKAIESFGLSLRAYYRIIKMARTIADLADVDAIKLEHIQEALMFRKELGIK